MLNLKQRTTFNRIVSAYDFKRDIRDPDNRWMCLSVTVSEGIENHTFDILATRPKNRVQEDTRRSVAMLKVILDHLKSPEIAIFPLGSRKVYQNPDMKPYPEPVNGEERSREIGFRLLSQLRTAFFDSSIKIDGENRLLAVLKEVVEVPHPETGDTMYNREIYYRLELNLGGLGLSGLLASNRE
ncbi:MAG: hypothetical protein KGH49_02135 [Candidatus Micrarchaeota archaeon]|nr:hypothetical protein [Candidatus Micrarchaeota archaeon]